MAEVRRSSEWDLTRLRERRVRGNEEPAKHSVATTLVAQAEC